MRDTEATKADRYRIETRFTTISVRGIGFAPSKKADLVKPPRSRARRAAVVETPTGSEQR